MPTDDSAPLSPAAIKRVHDIVGTLLYYAQAVDSTLLTVLSAIAARQANGTEAITDACNQLLDYISTHPDTHTKKSRTCMARAHIRTHIILHTVNFFPVPYM